MGVGKDSINRKCPWNMPCSRLRPSCYHPHSSLVSVLPEMLKTCLPLQDEMTHRSTREQTFSGALGQPSCLRKQRHTKSQKLWEHLSENSEFETTGRGITKRQAWSRAPL